MPTLPVAPGGLLDRMQFAELIGLANAKTGLKHRPFAVYAPAVTDVLNDRGAFVDGHTYNTLDKISHSGWDFVATANGVTVPPLDAVTGNPNGGWAQPWYSCLNRLKTELQAAMDYLHIKPWFPSVSGPWPCGGPDINYRNIYIYYPYRGHGETLTLSTGVAGSWSGRVTGVSEYLSYQNIVDGSTFFNVVVDSDTGDERAPGGETIDFHSAVPAAPDRGWKARMDTTVEFEVIVGGESSNLLNATFTYTAVAIGGKNQHFYFVDDMTAVAPNTIQVTDVTDSLGDPSGNLSVDASGWIPGASSWAITWGGWGGSSVKTGTVTATCTVSGIVAPGRYKVIFSVPTPTISATGSASINSYYDVDDVYHTVGTGELYWSESAYVALNTNINATGTYNKVFDHQEIVNGIHDSKQVARTGPANFFSTVPFAVYGVENWYRNEITGIVYDTPVSDFGGPTHLMDWGDPAVVPDWAYETVVTGTWGIVSSVPGYWYATTFPISDLGLNPYDAMPWNYWHVPLTGDDPLKNLYLNQYPPFVGGSIFGTNAAPAYGAGDAPADIPISYNHELLPWPKRWKPGVRYPLGFQLEDGNGNLVTQMRAGGRSGAVEPVWPTGVGTNVIEPDTVGARVTDPGAIWKLTKILKFTNPAKKFVPPVSHLTPPSYPVFWQNPTTDWKPGVEVGIDTQQFDSSGNTQIAIRGGVTGIDEPAWAAAVGGETNDGSVVWKTVEVNQKDVSQMANPVYDDGVTNVQGWWLYRISLIRVGKRDNLGMPADDTQIPVTLGCIRSGAFVSFGTFNTGETITLHLPIFTTTALCYQASEKVFVQPSIMTCGGSYGMWGGPGVPPAAAYINDTKTVLDLI